MKSRELSGNLELNNALSNLRQGDAVVLDIDNFLLRYESENGDEALSLSDKKLPDLLRYLKETSHPVILLTSQEDKYHDETALQLTKLGLKHDTYMLVHKDKSEMLIRQIKDNKENIKRLHIVNDKPEQFDNMETAFSKDGDFKKIERLYYQFQPKTQLLTDTDRLNNFPDTLEQISSPVSLGGGTESTFKVKENEQQQDYVLKFGDSQAQIKIEILMNILYERLGVNVPKVQAYQAMPPTLSKSLGLSQPTQTIQLSEYLDAAENQDEEAIIKQACHDFVIHAFMGNIDITKFDNFIQTKNGEIKLIDAGANFLFRAKGEKRDEEAHTINEIQDMRDPNKNKTGAEWFKDLTDEEIKNQVKVLMGKRDVIEKTIWDISQQLELPASLQQELLAAFSSRFDDLAQHYGFAIQKFAKRDKAAIEGKTAAGVLHLQLNEKEDLCVLLSKRVRHNWCDNFGGKSDKGDNTLAYTAQREVDEESKRHANDEHGVIRYSDRELAQASFHDIITLDEMGNQFLYRMYFVTALQSLDITELKDPEHTNHYWVPLKNLQSGLQQDLKIEEENQTTIQVKDENGNDLIIFPPLYEMLKQEPVLTLINGYIKNDPAVTRTQGIASNVPIEIGKEDKKIYQPLASPGQVKAEVVATQLKKAKVLDEIKQQRRQKEKSLEKQQEIIQEEKAALSQSEFHLKAIMGKDFDNAASIATNVKTFLDDYCQKKYSDQEKAQLIDQAVEMIKYEKQYPEKVFFYHGVSSQIAYAYTVYTALYRTLSADSSLETLRTDNALFHKCLNIQSFINHFQSFSEDKIIDNYDTGYMECALSTNLFLFGCHLSGGSNTIAYYTSNETASSIDLKDMLEASLKSMGVSDSLIIQLSELENEFPQRDQGALYQIYLNKDEIDHYAYLAGVRGVLNPLPTTEGDTTDVSRLLTAINNQEKVDTNYIEKVQARVMVPPDAPITTNHYNWGQQTDVNKQTKFDKQLDKLTQDLSYDILQHKNQFNKLNSKSALMRYLPNVMQQAGITPGENEISDDLIIQLVESGDFESIKTIVETHSEYKDKALVSTKKSYAGRVMDSQIANNRSLLERLLAMEHAGEMIRAIYTNRFYEGKLDKLLFHQVVNALDTKDRLQFLMEHKDKVQDGDSLALVLDKIPITEWVDIVNIFHDKINYFEQMLGILQRLPPNARLNFANKHAHKIESDDNLARVISALPVASQNDFALNHPDITQNGYDLADDLRMLSESERLDFANKHSYKIHNSNQLAFVLDKILKSERLDFANNHDDRILNGDDLADVLGKISEPERLDFANNHDNRIQNGDELAVVLGKIPESEQLDFANKHADKIQYIGDLVAVLNNIPDSAKVNFANEHGDKIQNSNDLAVVLNKILESERLDFANKHDNRILTGDDLAVVLGKIPDSEKVNFANEHGDKIQNDSQLVAVLTTLTKRHEFLTLYKEKTQNFEILSQALHLALKNNDPNIVEVLLDQGIDPTIPNQYGENAIYSCVQNLAKISDEKSVAFEKGSKMLQLLLENVKNPDIKIDDKGTTPLHAALIYAVQNAKLTLVNTLLKYNANPSLKLPGSESPLFYAFYNKNAGSKLGMVKALLDYGADSNINIFIETDRDTIETTPLIYYTREYGKSNKEDKKTILDIITKILTNGADLSMQEGNSKTALHYAVINWNNELVEVILKNSTHKEEKIPSIDIQDDSGKTALHYAIIEGNERMRNALIEAGANCNIQDKDGMTPLHYAAINKNLGKIQILIKNKADPNIQDKEGKTPLHYAVEMTYDINGNTRSPEVEPGIIKELLSGGAKIDIKNLKQRTAYDSANLYTNNIYYNTQEKKQLIELINPAKVLSVTNKTDTTYSKQIKHTGLFGTNNKAIAKQDMSISLNQAIRNKDLAKVTEILNFGANLNEVDNEGMTSLHIAVKVGNAAIVKALLAVKPDLNANNNDLQKTPLHYAAAKAAIIKSAESIEVLDALLVAGADPDIKDKNGKTSSDIAGVDLRERMEELNLQDNEPEVAKIKPQGH